LNQEHHVPRGGRDAEQTQRAMSITKKLTLVV